MALFPLRNLGQYGVNTDVDSLDLPISVFSQANNVRFIDGHISRGPVFAKLGQSTTNTAPRWAYSYQLQGASATYLVMTQDGSVASVIPNTPTTALTWTDVSVPSYTPSSVSNAFTATMLSNVVYINRPDRVPWYLGPTDTQFHTLTGWDSTWRCQALRSFNSSLVAINVTKGSTSYPTMVKTSDFAVFGTVPGTWTAATTNSATENVLVDLDEALIDGWALRDRFMLYTNNRTWYMQANGATTVYDYKPLFSNYGVINQNCIAEVNNQHFVFGSKDIWAHDGFTPRSVATGRVRHFIFNNLIQNQSYQFFVWSNPRLNEIMFCYVSSDPFCAFPVNDTIGYPGCNRAAVYNWMYDTWTFYDLPYIVGSGLGNASSSGLTYSTSTTTYETVSGSYQGLGDTSRLFNLAVGRGGSITTPILPLQNTGSWDNATHLYTYELLDSVVGNGLVVNVVNAPVYLENGLMDMDEVSKELRGYKIVTSVYPEARLYDATSSNPITFWFGSCDYSNQDVVFGTPMTFDGHENYKLDFTSAGRYLSMKIALGGTPYPFILSGMDLDVKMIGHR